MKTKFIIFIVAVATVTLSFTYGNVTKPTNVVSPNTTNNAAAIQSEPVGGMFADDVE